MTEKQVSEYNEYFKKHVWPKLTEYIYSRVSSEVNGKIREIFSYSVQCRLRDEIQKRVEDGIVVELKLKKGKR